jgi:hypothetical protein
MTEPSDANLEALRARARELIGHGRLPQRPAARTWGGPGSGLLCDLCDTSILSSEPEFELQLEPNASLVVRFHRRCHSIWESARQQSLQWTPIAQAAPPPTMVVEARITMAEGRSVILDVTCQPDETSGARVWLNATTRLPLPAGWQPLEWRRSVRSAADAVTPVESSVPKRA